jgi:REP element-mobilizing transposase RayT
MPEHCHLLIVPSDLADPSQIMQKMKVMNHAEAVAQVVVEAVIRGSG